MQPGCFDSCFRTDLQRFPSPNHYPPTVRKPRISMHMLKNHKLTENPEESINLGRHTETMTQQRIQNSVIDYQQKPLMQYFIDTAQKTQSCKNDGAKITGNNPPFIPKIVPLENNGIFFAKPIAIKDAILIKQPKHSSLYGGAKNIIGKMSGIFQTDKHSNHQQSAFIQQRTLSSQLNNEKECNSVVFSETRIDTNPFQDISLSNYKCSVKKQALRIGKMLGRGKYCHVHLCQDPNAGLIFTLKQIFKQQSIFPQIYLRISQAILLLMKIEHPNIVSCYSYVQDNTKISIFQQYAPTLLRDQMMKQGNLPIQKVRNYLQNIIQAVVMLHDCEWIHGNLNPSQIGCAFGVCKVRVSLTDHNHSNHNYLSDIHSIAFIGYQMAFGLIENLQNNEPYLPQTTSYRNPNLTTLVFQSLAQKSDPKEKDIRDFLEMLLNTKENQRLSAGWCFTHPFFCGEK